MSEAASLLALEEGGPFDFGGLREERVQRCLDEMGRRGVDVLLLGRDANVRFVSGARRLWYAGSRPFAPSCVVVRDSAEVHLMSIHEDGIPEAIPRDHVYGFAWSPKVFVRNIAAIPGVASARVVGIDGMTPTFESLLGHAIPNATFIDGEALVREARAEKSAREIDCVRAAVAVSESALAAVTRAIAPGVAEQTLSGIFCERAAELGVTIPSAEPAFCASPRRSSPTAMTARAAAPRGLRDGRTLASGDLVTLDAGVLVAGYEGGLARTWPCGSDDRVRSAGRALHRRWRRAMDAMLDACIAGRPAGDLRSAHEATGEPLPGIAIASGIGLGVEPPRVGSDVPPQLEARFVLREGSVLALQTYIFEEGVGGVLGREIVHLAASGPELLTRMDHGPLGA